MTSFTTWLEFLAEESGAETTHTDDLGMQLVVRASSGRDLVAPSITWSELSRDTCSLELQSAFGRLAFGFVFHLPAHLGLLLPWLVF
jgi:hypothetical protein